MGCPGGVVAAWMVVTGRYKPTEVRESSSSHKIKKKLKEKEIKKSIQFKCDPNIFTKTYLNIKEMYENK